MKMVKEYSIDAAANLFAAALACCVLLAGCGAETDSISNPDGDVGVNVQQAAAIDQTDRPRDAPKDETGAIDERAVALLKQMTSTLAGLQEFTVTLETGFEVLQPNGQKLEFGSSRTATIRRPKQARFTYQKRSGVAGELVFDGSDIWAYVPEQNVYATISQPGNIDTTLDFVTIELGIPVPVDDFFSEDPSVALAEGVSEAIDLGPSTIGGHPGRQIALRKPGVDYQIWISDANALPVRLVITYRDDPGRPQFWARFVDWNTAPTYPEDRFEFQPPQGAERIRFATYDGSEEEVIEGDAP